MFFQRIDVVGHETIGYQVVATKDGFKDIAFGFVVPVDLPHHLWHHQTHSHSINPIRGIEIVLFLDRAMIVMRIAGTSASYRTIVRILFAYSSRELHPFVHKLG